MMTMLKEKQTVMGTLLHIRKEYHLACQNPYE